MDYPKVEIFNDGNADLSIQFIHDLNLLHFYIEKWNLSVYKDLLDKWDIILESLRESGLTEIHSCIGIEDTHTQKFQSMFGLEEYMESDKFKLYRMEL